MADASLDDFFAKKDKSKKKPKSKTTDGNTVTAPASALKAVKKEKRRDKDNSVSSPWNKTVSNNGKQDDDDWNDFEEEKAVDYSGLRIQNLQIAKDDPEREGEGEEDEYDEDGEVKEKRDASGPWKKGSHAPTATPAPKPAEKPKEDPVPTTKVPGKYVPPAQRNSSGASTTSSFPNSRRKKEAPNLRSELDFPTLGGGPEDSQANSSCYIEASTQRRGVALENKFSALQD